jgi:hypothetical protein
MFTMNTPLPAADPVKTLNDTCFCLPSQSGPLHRQLAARLDLLPGYNDAEGAFSPFSDASVFLRKDDYETMSALIAAMETVTRLPEYREEIARRQPDLAWPVRSRTAGLLMGYDFHVTPEGPRLIEINTNAGGAFIAKMLERHALASMNCCPGETSRRETTIDDALHEMFLSEWALARPGRPLRTVAIVDDAPELQYLFPDMLLAADFLTRRGIDARVCDSRQLTYDDGAVLLSGRRIDMIYNRMTDFTLANDNNDRLLTAYESDQVVLSPAPLHHALYADKRNLTLLSDRERLSGWGVDETTRRALSLVPETRQVPASDSACWWNARKNYFFKPHSGFGSKAAYRGDKVTRKVWNEIQSGDFVAQRLIPPARRGTETDGERIFLKYDIRVYAYAGKPLFPVARLYSGQTTNFRTPGGGFAEVIVM